MRDNKITSFQKTSEGCHNSNKSLHLSESLLVILDDFCPEGIQMNTTACTLVDYTSCIFFDEKLSTQLGICRYVEDGGEEGKRAISGTWSTSFI
ncbi:hypothetical protein Y1Q_0002013 [Alligator mississippiensis]|uniref:Uncharacterized protein n=1 Tax=Alligator mississippiensis TaxID=8496 RepID=A0A151MNW7_ALLMI|nr:hypothetical protein Y1Q_0002013 [Alligator mississippiensis]